MAKFAAFGAKLQYNNTGWVDIAGLKDITGPGLSADVIDVTSHDSTGGYREKMKALKDSGEVTFELVFDPDDTTGGHKKLRDKYGEDTPETLRLVYNTTNTETWEFSAFVTGFEPGQPLEGAITANVTLAITGSINFDPA